MQSKRRATIYLVLWILLIVPTFLAVLTLAYSLAAPEVVGYGVWPIFVVCSGGTAFPLLIFVALWWKHHRRYRALSDLAASLRVYREIPLGDLARRFRKTENEIEALVAAAVSEGYATGWIDLANRRFVSSVADSPLAAAPPAPPQRPLAATEPSAERPGLTPPARFCRKCGNRVYPVAGTDEWECWSCGSVQGAEG